MIKYLNITCITTSYVFHKFNYCFLDKMSLEILAQEKVWLDKSKYADAERVYYEKLSKVIDIFIILINTTHLL